jgi:hypothetical protein
MKVTILILFSFAMPCFGGIGNLWIAAPPEPPFPTNSLLIINITGQSLASGSGSTQSLSTATSTNLYTQGNGYPYSWPFVIAAGLYSPVYERQNSETITTASLQQAYSLGAPAMAAVVNAIGGEPYSNLKKGTGVYSNGVSWMTNAFASTIYPTKIVPCWFIVHGEADATSSTYQSDIAEWAGDVAADAVAITGQSQRVVLFHSQISTQSGISGSRSDLAMLREQQKSSRSNITVCAKYYLPYDAVDSPHLTSVGYQWLGEYYGKAFYDEFYNGGWNPLMPVAAVATNNIFTITFTNTIGGLVLDVANVMNATNYGFNILTNGAPLPISTVTISGASSNQVTITTTANPIGDTQLYLGIWNTGAVTWTGGTTNQLRTNLRNSDARLGALSGRHLYDWAIHSTNTVTIY